MSSFRSRLKVPRYGLFYFEIDKTLSILPSNKVKKVAWSKEKSGKRTKVLRFYYEQLLLAMLAVRQREIKCVTSFLNRGIYFVRQTNSMKRYSDRSIMQLFDVDNIEKGIHRGS